MSRKIAGKEDPRFEPGLSAILDVPWQRLETDRRHTAWVQIAPGPLPVVVRFVTRYAGKRVLPAPRRPFCVGKSNAIEVCFEPDSAYARYRVERRVGVAGDFAPAGEVERPPFRDLECQPDIRSRRPVCPSTSCESE